MTADAVTTGRQGSASKARPTLVLTHGWGFDASLWAPLLGLLPDFTASARDRGYFGPRLAPAVEAPTLAIGHSLGALLLALDPPPGCTGLIAINGFDHFAGNEAVPPRLLERMRKRFAVAPEDVLADFRQRCGETGPVGRIHGDRLGADLDLLAEADARRALPFPILVLNGSDDPILPEALRAAGFAGARRETLPGGGHLLPLTDPHWCAEQIRAFAG